MPDRTRVLWLSKGLALGGQERLLEFLARAHDDEKFSIECAYVVPGLDHQVPALEAAGVACRCLGVAGKPWAWVVTLRKLLAEGRFDVVHVHSPLLAAVVRPLVRVRRSANRPVVMTTDHLEWSGYHPLTRWANALTSPLDDVPIAVSPAVQRSMRGPAARRARVMVQGIEVDAVRATLPHTPEVPEFGDSGTGPADAIRIVTVANLRAQKDYGTLIDAARRVVDQRPDVRFVAVGDDAGPYGDEMRARRDALGLADHFELLGARDDAVAVMASAEIFVVTSAFEAGPITAMEAAALGRPIVSTDVGIVTDLFTDGQNCLRVPVGDVSALAGALIRAVDDAGLRASLGQEANRLADEQFDIRRVIAELQELYAEPGGRRRSH